MLLAFFFYVTYAVFLWKVLLRIPVLFEIPPDRNGEQAAGLAARIKTLAQSALDIVFLFRLLRCNPRLWIGEWLFHLSFVFVLIRHLRYALNPVPAFIVAVQPVGVWAGYLLPMAILYIVFIKYGIERTTYLSRYNLFLSCTIFLISLTGLFMRIVSKPDLPAVKGFMVGIFTFSLQPHPDGLLFSAHFSLVLLLLVSLPAHFFAAPYSIMEARARENNLNEVLHGQ